MGPRLEPNLHPTLKLAPSNLDDNSSSFSHSKNTRDNKDASPIQSAACSLDPRNFVINAEVLGADSVPSIQQKQTTGSTSDKITTSQKPAIEAQGDTDRTALYTVSSSELFLASPISSESGKTGDTHNSTSRSSHNGSNRNNSNSNSGGGILGLGIRSRKPSLTKKGSFRRAIGRSKSPTVKKVARSKSPKPKSKEFGRIQIGSTARNKLRKLEAVAQASKRTNDSTDTSAMPSATAMAAPMPVGPSDVNKRDGNFDMAGAGQSSTFLTVTTADGTVSSSTIQSAAASPPSSPTTNSSTSSARSASKNSSRSSTGASNMKVMPPIPSPEADCSVRKTAQEAAASTNGRSARAAASETSANSSKPSRSTKAKKPKSRAQEGSSHAPRQQPSSSSSSNSRSQSHSRSSAPASSKPHSSAPPSSAIASSIQPTNATVTVQKSRSKNSNSTRTNTSSKNSNRRRGVNFHSVQIRTYAYQLGDNPAVSMGAPLTISWHYDELPTLSVTDYEAIRSPHRRTKLIELLLNYYQREAVLVRCGYSASEVTNVTRTINRIRRQRQRTAWNGPLSFYMEYGMECFKSKLRRQCCKGGNNAVVEYASTPTVSKSTKPHQDNGEDGPRH